jgi:hypothetical protein
VDLGDVQGEQGPLALMAGHVEYRENVGDPGGLAEAGGADDALRGELVVIEGRHPRPGWLLVVHPIPGLVGAIEGVPGVVFVADGGVGKRFLGGQPAVRHGRGSRAELVSGEGKERRRASLAPLDQ